MSAVPKRIRNINMKLKLTVIGSALASAAVLALLVAGSAFAQTPGPGFGPGTEIS
jgi:hypothetical protein